MDRETKEDNRQDKQTLVLEHEHDDGMLGCVWSLGELTIDCGGVIIQGLADMVRQNKLKFGRTVVIVDGLTER